jgi:hypothetical protein
MKFNFKVARTKILIQHTLMPSSTTNSIATNLIVVMQESEMVVGWWNICGGKK